jgi:hypothetical protein
MDSLRRESFMTSPVAAIRPWQRTLSALLLAAYLPACSAWHVGTPTPAQFIEKEHPESVRVTRNDGTTLTLGSPMVRGDSLIGTTTGGLARPEPSATIGIPLADVRQVEVRRTNTTATLLIVGVALIAVIVIGACAASSSNQFYDPC